MPTQLKQSPNNRLLSELQRSHLSILLTAVQIVPPSPHSDPTSAREKPSRQSHTPLIRRLFESQILQADPSLESSQFEHIGSKHTSAQFVADSWQITHPPSQSVQRPASQNYPNRQVGRSKSNGRPPKCGGSNLRPSMSGS